MRRSIAVVLTLAAVSSCGGLRAEDNDHPLDAAEVPYDLLAAPTTTTTEPPPPTTTTLPWRTNLWYVAGERVVPAPRQLREQPDVAQVLRLLLNGPSDDQPLVRSALDTGDATVAGQPVGGTLTIELRPDFGARSPSEQVLALAQLLFTVTEVPGVGRVVFRIGDADLAVPLPNGQLAQGSVSRDDYAVLAFPQP
jgi:hypothetical protein